MTEPAHPAWLEGRSPALSGQQFDIGFGTTRLGRSPACPVVIADPLLSREHAEIRYESGTFTITDLGSTHGTWVDGQQVQHAPLFDGTVIRVGDSELTFHLAQNEVRTAMIGAGGLTIAAVPPAAPPRVRTDVPPVPPRAPAMTPTAATKKAGGRRGWLIGCAIALVVGLCGCALIVGLAMLGGLPFGLDAAINRTLGRVSEALTGDGLGASPPYTREDLALALAMPTVDERGEILANFGSPDEFEISIVQVEGGQVRLESWRYYGYGTRVDFVDGEIIWTIDLEPGPAKAVFPAWYDPLAFETGMTLEEARDVLTSASPASFVPEETDLSEGGEELAGGVMLVGDQIMLAFDQGLLVYAETFGVSFEEAAQ